MSFRNFPDISFILLNSSASRIRHVRDSAGTFHLPSQEACRLTAHVYRKKDLLSAYASGLMLLWNILLRKQDASAGTSEGNQEGHHKAAYLEKPLPPLPDIEAPVN